MSKAIFFAFLVVLAGCGDNKSDSLSETDESDLSGTWLHTQVQYVYDRNSGEYISTEYYESTIILSDTGVGMTTSECSLYQQHDYLGKKGDDYINLQIAPSAPTYFQVAKDKFETELDRDINSSYSTNTKVDKRLTIEKLSSNVVIDKGLLVLNGPISINEYSHVCVGKKYSTFNSTVYYDLHVPFDDYNLIMQMKFSAHPSVGVLTYTKENTEASILNEFDVSSTSSYFLDRVDSSTLAPDNVLVNVHQSSEDVLSGEFSFLGHDGGDYSGEFYIDLTN